MISSRIIKPEKLVEAYIDEVLSGSRAAGRYERFGVERHLWDLETGHERGWYFDEDLAYESCLFFPYVLKHSIGEYAGEPFDLTPCQAYCVASIQGWRNASDKTRRFRKAFLTFARKNGKTTFGAGLGNLLTFFDWSPVSKVGVEVAGRGYCAATKKPQAALLWGEIARQIKQSPALDKRTKIQGEDNVNGGRVIVKAAPFNGSTIETIGSDALRQDGLNASWILKDELHAWQKGLKDLDEKLSTGGASRAQPFEGILTTAGSDSSEIWEDEIEFAYRVLTGAHQKEAIDDSYFAVVCEIDEDDDPLDPAVWPKANPHIGISVREKYLQAQANEAALRPTKLNAFTRYHCNRRVGSYENAYPPELWERGLVDQPVDPAPNALCFGGVDLGRSDDWAAVTLVFPERIKGKQTDPDKRWRYQIISKAWACKGTATNSTDYTREPYATWIRDGLLEFTTDEVIDTAPLKQYLVDARKRYTLKKVAYDKTFAHEVASSLLNDYGVPVEDYPQTYQAYTEPIKSFEKTLRDGRVAIHDPVLTWQSMNAQVIYDSRGLCMLDKGNQKRWRKIDGMVALLMAYSEAIYAAKRTRRARFITPGSGDRNVEKEQTA